MIHDELIAFPNYVILEHLQISGAFTASSAIATSPQCQLDRHTGAEDYYMDRIRLKTVSHAE